MDNQRPRGRPNPDRNEYNDGRNSNRHRHNIGGSNIEDNSNRNREDGNRRSRSRDRNRPNEYNRSFNSGGDNRGEGNRNNGGYDRDNNRGGGSAFHHGGNQGRGHYGGGNQGGGHYGSGNQGREHYGGSNQGGGHYGGGNQGRGHYGGGNQGGRNYGGGNQGREHYGGGNQGGGNYGGGNRGMPDVQRPPGNLKLYTNFFLLENQPNWGLYQYCVRFEPDLQSKRLRLALIRNFDDVFKNSKAYDGGGTFYSSLKLDQNLKRMVKTRNGEDVEITIEFVKAVSPLTETKASASNDQAEEEESGSISFEYYRILNVILKRCFKYCGFEEFGKQRAYFDFNAIKEIRHLGLNLVNGFLASFDRYDNQVLLCTESVHKLFRRGTVLDIINDIVRKNRNNMSAIKEECERALIGQPIMTAYKQKNVYRIGDIDWDKKPTDTFKKGNENITFLDYFKTYCHVEIRDHGQPMLACPIKQRGQNNQALPDRIVYLVPELCTLTGISLTENLSFQDRKAIDQEVKSDPSSRYDKLKTFMRKIKDDEKSRADMRSWGLEFSSDLFKLEAKQLASVEIFFDQKSSKKNSEKSWDNELKTASPLASVNLTNWLIVYNYKDEERKNKFTRELQYVSGNFFKWTQPTFLKVNDSRDFVSCIQQNYREDLQMVVVILPNKDAAIYSAIKRICCCDLGIASQLVTSQLIGGDKVKSAITKIAIQMNCKLGGEIWGVMITCKSIMVIGIDVTKDTSSGESVVAITASMDLDSKDNLNCRRYYSKCIKECAGQTFVNSLNALMKEILGKFYEKNEKLPERLVIYRDGVSDGQLKGVIEFEYPQIEVACSHFYNGKLPKITLIVVKKRSNAKFFLPIDQNRYQNPPSGTVIDSGVVKRRDKEFYLIPQTVSRGTVSPTLFHIVKDNSKAESEKLQSLTYRLTHMYYNWAGQVRVPAPVMYANKLSRLVGESIKRPHSEKLNDKLFYL